MKFCIVGTGRCGTTLLRNIFNSHPEIFVFDETHWIIKMYEMFGTGPAETERLFHIINSTYHITGKPVTVVDRKNLKPLGANLTVREFCDEIGNYFARQNNKIIWADKTPDYGPFMNIIQKLWPKCKFIHLIRHGADVAVSMSKHPGYRWLAAAHEDSWVPAAYNSYYKAIDDISKRPLQEFGDLWSRRLKRIRTESDLLADNSYCEIFFEDLILNPSDCLQKLTEFLEISAPDELIDKAIQKIEPERHQSKRNSSEFLNERALDLLQELGYE